MRKQKKEERKKNEQSAALRKDKKQKDNTKSIPKTVTDTIPYDSVYENGIIEVEPGLFSKTYRIPAANFKTKGEEDQITLQKRYADFISTFGGDCVIEITQYNNTIDEDEFKRRVYIPMQPDDLNSYREEYNEMLANQMKAAKNNLETEKYLTVTMAADHIKDAIDKFVQTDMLVSESFSQMCNKEDLTVTPMTLVERLELLRRIYNQDEKSVLLETRKIDGRDVPAFSLANLAKQGITTKELIAPSSMSFQTRQGTVGSSLVRSYYVSVYPEWIKGTIFTDFAAIPANMLASVLISPMEQVDAIRLIRRQNVNINANVVERQKKSAKSGIGYDMISPTLIDAKDEAEELLAKITKDNMRLFTVVMAFTLFAKTEEEMQGYENQLKLIASKNLLTVQPLDFQQENALATTLPLGNKRLYNERLMTTESIASIIPFDVQEVRQKGGMYYGLNASSKNMLLYNRALSVNVNANGCILGMPGSGKSFAAKREMVNVLLNTDDPVFVIDPEREYKPLADAMNGTIIRIANGSHVYLNPFDLNLANADDNNDPVKVKIDFICTICEIMIGGRYGLTPIEKNLIDRTVMQIYEPHVDYLKRTGKMQDMEKAPTLRDFYNVLCSQPELEAQSMAVALERYVKGSLDLFAHRTNVDAQSRFTVYDIKDIGSGLKELGLQITLDNIWNQMIENFGHGKKTWIYIDEFYLLMSKPTSAEYIKEIWKRARKWYGIPTAITQNVEEMLQSEEARTVINTSSFLIILGQSPINRQQLSAMLNISQDEQKYIGVSKPGTGLIKVGSDLIPVSDSFPTNTKLYQAMTTRPEERQV